MCLKHQTTGRYYAQRYKERFWQDRESSQKRRERSSQERYQDGQENGQNEAQREEMMAKEHKEKESKLHKGSKMGPIAEKPKKSLAEPMYGSKKKGKK